jgi:flagellar biosynthesis protein FlhF
MTAPATTPTTEATRYRLVVRSAAEAVALVRERFGPSARVLSVRQIEAGGLARFLQKPRLEVIVEVGAVTPALAAGSGEKTDTPAETATAAGRSTAHEGESSAGASGQAAAPAIDATPTPRPGARATVSLLRATGLDEMLLERVRADDPALDWDRSPPAEALARLAAWLRRQYNAIPRRPAGARRVFFGSCGTGKTTALCKLLALDVFVRGRQPAVLKLDGEQPNATDGLAAFCEVLGAPLLRSAGEVDEFDRESLVYVDVPGVGLDSQGEQARLAQTLDALRADTRVLVVNAACESEVIAASYEMGRAVGATHVVFTHLDEVRRPGKLWRFILFGGLRPLLLGSSPSPAGDGEEEVFSALLARTFPPDLARVAGAEGGRT